MAKATQRNLDRHRGDTYPLEVTISKSGRPLDLTGCTARMTAVNVNGATVFMKNATIQDALGGKLHIPFEPNDFPHEGVFDYDVQLTDTAGYIYTTVVGQVTIHADYTV